MARSATYQVNNGAEDAVNKREMSVDPKDQNAELQKLIGANKERIANTQKVLRDLQKRAGQDQTRPRRPVPEKGQ